MTSRERIHAIIAGQPAERCAFWLGNPHRDTWPIYLDYFGVDAQEEVRSLLGDDLRWINAQAGSYRHPDGHGPWSQLANDPSKGLASGGALADLEDPAALADLAWPSLDHLDFSEVLTVLDEAGDVYRASGFWCPFFHDMAALFGMENYFVKMHTDPEVIHAATRRICDFYLAANERFFAAAGDRVDASFFGNDFGTQLDLLVGPAQFDEFLLPWMRRLADQGHAHGHQVILHSCGAIAKVIDRLIDIGVDCLHPLQAKAAGMDADRLACDFGGRIAFMGGIDTQHLLVHGSPQDVRDDVRRVIDRLGPRLIVSPSHEALLPNVPPENVLAMSEAVRAN